MSLPLLIFLIVIFGVCAFIFTKTVSNDAKNDFRLRDILSQTDDDTVISNKNLNRVKTEEATVDNVYSSNIYEDIVNSQKTNSSETEYSTTAHSENNSEQKSETPKYNQNTYYERINDDACFEDDYEDLDYNADDCVRKTSKSSKIINYIKIFWRGIIFTIGLLVSIYSFIGLAYNVQTSNDALIYSLWLLIGVILIK